MARDTTAAVAETATEATAEAARSGLQVVRRTSAAADQATRRSAEGTAELGQGLTELVHQQTRHNAATLLALSETVDWERWFRIQGEYLHASLERMAGLAQRYLEASQAVLTAAAKVGPGRPPEPRRQRSRLTGRPAAAPVRAGGRVPRGPQARIRAVRRT